MRYPIVVYDAKYHERLVDIWLRKKGRSALDGTGRPFPLLHLELKNDPSG
ncbi:acetyltransferase [Paenibacillus sp. NAIST15-1]|nr:acetyltransferase [Paenibacillus sp. NAIST15-1]